MRAAARAGVAVAAQRYSTRTVDEKVLVAELRADGLHVTEWTDAPGTSYDEHTHAHREIRVVLEGEITFVVGAERFVLRPGDRIEFLAGQAHAARVGDGGVRYLAGTER